MITTVLMIISLLYQVHGIEMFHDMIIMGPGRYNYHNFMITAQPYLQCHIPLYGVPAL